jgi:hypothetical protein
VSRRGEELWRLSRAPSEIHTALGNKRLYRVCIQHRREARQRRFVLSRRAPTDQSTSMKEKSSKQSKKDKPGVELKDLTSTKDSKGQLATVAKCLMAWNLFVVG